MDPTVDLAIVGGGSHRVRLRRGTPLDRRTLVRAWSPLLERAGWLDREWPWEEFGQEGLAFEIAPEWVVLADEIADDARGDIVGVLATTGPVPVGMVGLQDPTVLSGDVLWIEYIAIAPSIRPRCSDADRRVPVLKGVGASLMIAAIRRSEALGLEGRLGLHAEGTVACDTYTKWKMQKLEDVSHPAGGTYPCFYGSGEWATAFLKRTPRVPTETSR